jgi:RNA polymerase sigma factor (sigma-70 family)
MTEQSDKDLLLKYLEQADESAFSALVQRHAGLVLGTALRIVRDREAAEEITQNVFTTLARKAKWLSGEGGLAGWLYRSTVLEARFRSSSEARRRQREQIAVDLGTTMKPDDSLLQSLVPLLDDGLMELGDKDRHAILCRFFEAKTLREVGAVLGAGEDAAQKRVSKSLDQLARFFRRRGYTAVTAGIVARTLQAAYLSTPTELAAEISVAALAAAGAGSFSTIGLYIAKFMTLTKLQTASLCVLIAAAPIGYEWTAGTRLRRESVTLHQRLRQTERDLQADARQQALLQRRIQAAEDSIATAGRELARLRGVLALAGTGQQSGLYLWSEQSDYVRLPKTLATQIMLSGAHELVGAFPPQRDQDAPVLADGSMATPLSAALGVTPAEQQTLTRTFSDFSAQFQQAEAARTYPTNVPPQQFHVGNWPSKTIVTQAAPPDQTEQTRENLRAQLVNLLGEERTAVFWKQAEPTFRESFNDFGALERVQTVAFHQGEELSTWNATRHPGDATYSTWSNSSGKLDTDSIPENLRPLVSAWRAQHASPAGGPLP